MAREKDSISQSVITPLTGIGAYSEGITVKGRSGSFLACIGAGQLNSRYMSDIQKFFGLTGDR
jgi:hypothetical protein